MPENLSRELHPLVTWHRSQTKSLSRADRKTSLRTQLGHNNRRIQIDDASRVIVKIRLDGSVPAADVKSSLAAMDAGVTAEHVAERADGRDGTLTVHLPLDRAVEAAKTPGIFSVLTAHRPRRRVGRVTSQGVASLHTDAVNALGYTGKGITVGVLSDSYNVATKSSVGYAVATRAADDVASGDLPGTNNPDGYRQPVLVLQDGSSDPDAENADEGRALLQIVHDVAPDAALVFSTAGDSVDEFAANIRTLRTNSDALCDVIVDDIGFDDEPFFSDGVVAKMVDQVVTSTTLAGRPVIFYSAAGNDGDLSYTAIFTPVTDAEGRASKIGNVQLGGIPSSLTGGGFHNFKGADLGRGEQIVQKVTVSQGDAFINFQWDDPFLSGGVSTSYCLLVFDGDGNYLPRLSGTDNNFSTGEAYQTAYLPLNNDGTDTRYQLVISRRPNGTQRATHLRYIVEDAAVVIGKYLHTGQPTLFGHSGAANADGVAAYDVHDTSVPESYESFGPVTIYFDAQGNRLATPVTRQQPTISAVDGVDTTFFEEGPLDSTDSDGDGYPNFYGTSAAAPHAAGVAALLLQAAGGRGSLDAAQMRDLLGSTATVHDLDPAFSIASFSSSDGLFRITLTAAGDASNNSSFDQKFFTLTYSGPAGSSLRKTAIDISPAGETFDTSVDDGYPFTIGAATNVVKAEVLASLSGGAQGVGGGKLTLLFTPGTFLPGGSLAFGIDRDDASNSSGNSADLLGGATVTTRVILADGSKLKASGEFINQRGQGYSPDVGFGLINAEAALNKLLGR